MYRTENKTKENEINFSDKRSNEHKNVKNKSIKIGSKIRRFPC